MRPFALTLALTATLLALPATAQNVAFGGMRADSKAPVQVTADNLSVDQATGQAVFTGNVVIGQGDMRLAADKVSVTYAQGDQSRISRLHATGHVTLVSGQDAAEAAEGVYDVDSGQVTLTGDVVLMQGASVLAGNQVQVDLNTGTASVAGRVRTILQPGAN